MIRTVISPEEVTEKARWRSARARKTGKLRGSAASLRQTGVMQDRSSLNHLGIATKQNAKTQVIKANWMPLLPKEDVKTIVRPKGGLDIPKVGSPIVMAAIFQAARINQDGYEDTVCPNTQ